MITFRWKACPHCSTRYGFDQHGGLTRGWQAEFIGSPYESCPGCGATLPTGKVRRISELSPDRRISLFATLAFECFGLAVWTIVIAGLIGLGVWYLSKSTIIAALVAGALFAGLAIRIAHVQIRDFQTFR